MSAAPTSRTTLPTHVTRVPVTTVWTAPDSPRPVDEAVVREAPDAAAWLAELDAHGDDDQLGRLGLHGLVETQLLAGEPVVVTEVDASGRWSHVVAPWQPSPKDPRGYPGWVPSAHLEPVDAERAVGLADLPATTDASPGPTDEHPALSLARAHQGLLYLWSGTSPLGFDCSGLVMHVWRTLGVVVSRDAYAQAETSQPVAVDAVQPGDLYFFARPGRRIHHVGIVVAPGRMVHASETGGVLVEEDLPQERLDTLVAAGRLPQP